MSQLETIIKETEEKWLETLYFQVKTIFKKHVMPSHNEDHHLRVWKYSMMILEALYKTGIRIDKADLESLMIAVFFHDTGLVITPGPDHGNSGEALCIKWMETNSITTEVEAQKILYAIRHHDDKKYLHDIPLISNQKINLLGILGISDDLDAFGFTGIYRYMEIYLLRGTNFKELGNQVLFNINNRFMNFLHQCGQFPTLINIHKSRYEITERFFGYYNDQLRNNLTGNNYFRSGPCSIARFVYKQIIQDNNSVERLCKKGIEEFTDISDKEFFINLWKEWNTENKRIGSFKD